MPFTSYGRDEFLEVCTCNHPPCTDEEDDDARDLGSHISKATINSLPDISAKDHGPCIQATS